MPHTPHRIQVTRRPEKFISDDSRVITRFFHVGGEHRIRAVIDRVMGLTDDRVRELLAKVHDDFSQRHRGVDRTFARHFHMVKQHVPDPQDVSDERRLLIGSYFTMEYSIESAALFNPSMVSHPDQTGLPEGTQRYIMSLRATGEGHVSSIVFRTGTVDHTGHLEFDKPPRFAAKMKVREDRRYEKRLFFLKLVEMSAYNDAARAVLAGLPETFELADLDHRISEVRDRPDKPSPFTETAENMLWLAKSNYSLEVPPETDPSEIVIFPTSENESRGIEDVRLTRFIDDDGGVKYYGTYTAYNGFRILPQLLETSDFQNFQIHTLNGKYVQNKGMALFPRKIDGVYYMISRLDGENMFIMRSDMLHFWNECRKLQEPRYPWEFIQIGNCGAPLETDEGWLLLTHGVGPMRQYCIGATLLDLEDPSKIIGTLPVPLLAPEEDERNGYVPNVVYSCGAMIHDDLVVLPYAMSDSATSFATVCLSDLLSALTSHHKGDDLTVISSQGTAQSCAIDPSYDGNGQRTHRLTAATAN